MGWGEWRPIGLAGDYRNEKKIKRNVRGGNNFGSTVSWLQ